MSITIDTDVTLPAYPVCGFSKEVCERWLELGVGESFYVVTASRASMAVDLVRRYSWDAKVNKIGSRWRVRKVSNKVVKIPVPCRGFTGEIFSLWPRLNKGDSFYTSKQAQVTIVNQLAKRYGWVQVSRKEGDGWRVWKFG